MQAALPLGSRTRNFTGYGGTCLRLAASVSTSPTIQSCSVRAACDEALCATKSPALGSLPNTPSLGFGIRGSLGGAGRDADGDRGRRHEVRVPEHAEEV